MQANRQLEFDDNPSIHEQIDSIASFPFHVFVNERDRLLTFERNVTQAQLAGQALFIGSFEQTWAQHSMDFDCCADDFVC